MEKTSRYDVEHPKWEQKEVLNYDLKVDFELNYGQLFKRLNDQNPDSVFYYEGSDITVSNKTLLK